MRPPLSELLVLDERARPRGAAWNMALDEALLSRANLPVLRFYRWAAPAVSFGYFLPAETAAAVAGGREIMRRWTGGGIVEHGADFTWSLIVPAPEPFSRTRPAESYSVLHGAVAAVLRSAGIAAVQVDATAPAPAGGLCFSAPAPGDLLVAGKKIAGAGQRRCRHGLLHQASLGGVRLPEDFPRNLAAVLSGIVHPFPDSQLPLTAAEDLVTGRYGTGSWLRRR